MNILLNTPILRSDTIRQDFDNKVLWIFMLIIFMSVMFGLLFIELNKQFGPQSSINGSEEPNSPPITRNA